MRTDLLKITLEQLFKSRLHFGDSKNKLETAFIYYLLGTRHNITIFDLEKLLYNLKIIYSALSELVAQRGFFFLLNVNNNLTLNLFLNKFLNKYNTVNNFYLLGLIHQKWINGLFSNWQIIYNKIKYLKSLNSLNFRREKDKIFLENLKNVKNLRVKIIPDLIFLFNYNEYAAKELANLNIPTISLINNNGDIKNSLYTLLGNMESPESIIFYCQLIEEAIKAGHYKEQEQFLYYFILKLKKNLIKFHD